MCSIDLEAAQVWIESDRRARKVHQCSCCCGAIAPGQTYLVHFSIMDGDVTSEKMCEPCQRLRDDFSEAHSHYPGGREAYIPTPSGLPGLLRECISEDDDGVDRWKLALAKIEARAQP